jgi:hypothetical protein
MFAFPSRPEGWKVAVGIGAAIVIAPVMVLVLFVLLVATLPVLPFVATLFVGVWVSRQPRPRSISAAPPIAFRPTMGHPAAR